MDGYSDSKAAQMLVSAKDAGGALNLNPLEFKLFVREFEDRQGCQTKRNNSNRDDNEEEGRDGSEVYQREKHDQVKIKEEEKQEDNFDMFVSSLKIKVPSAEESRGLEDDDDEGMKTPASLDQKIAVSLKSPPAAPRKPKALPLKKRKANRHPRLLFDLSSEIQLWFPPVVCADLGGDKIKKKSRQESS